MLQLRNAPIFAVVDLCSPWKGKKKTFPKCFGNKNMLRSRGGSSFPFPPQGTEEAEYASGVTWRCDSVQVVRGSTWGGKSWVTHKC